MTVEIVALVSIVALVLTVMFVYVKRGVMASYREAAHKYIE